MIFKARLVVTTSILMLLILPTKTSYCQSEALDYHRNELKRIIREEISLSGDGGGSLEVSGDIKKHSNKHDDELYRLVESKHKNSMTIRKIQELLSEGGYNPGTVDGIIGSRTRRALVKWKEEKGYSVSLEWAKPKRHKRKGKICFGLSLLAPIPVKCP